jgi:hypothetical protein
MCVCMCVCVCDCRCYVFVCVCVRTCMCHYKCLHLVGIFVSLQKWFIMLHTLCKLVYEFLFIYIIIINIYYIDYHIYCNPLYCWFKLEYFFFFFFVSTGNWTQSLVLEALYHLSLVPGLFAFWVSSWAFAWSGLGPQFYLYFLSSWDCMHVPPPLACFGGRVSITFAWANLEPN